MRNVLKIFVVFTFCFQAHALKIYDTHKETFLSPEDFYKELLPHANIILGETHNQVPIQKAQAQIIESVVKVNNLENQFTVAWEFLNYPDQQQVEQSFEQYRLNLIDGTTLLTQLFPNLNKPQMHSPYLSFFETAKNLGGKVLATNAPREWKSKITAGGLGNLEPQYIPATMRMGSANYFERFEEAMQNHIPAHKMQNYYEAQCYTDSVIAHSLDEFSTTGLVFLIVGHFHTDYNDGVVEQLIKTSSKVTINIRIIDIKGMNQKEVNQLLIPHKKYGPLAHYLYMIEE